MWPFNRPSKNGAGPENPAPTRSDTLLAELVERVAVLEGELTGLKLGLEHLSESTQKALGKLAARARRDNEQQADHQAPPDEDPRITALRDRRRRRA